MRRAFPAAVIVILAATVAGQAPGSSLKLQVTEMGGIRRTQFPASARLSFKQGELADPANLRLLQGQTEVPVQGTSDSRWPDGSVSALIVDFNASLGPRESSNYTLEFGNGVKSGPAARGLTVTEDADAFQVGNVRFNKSGSPLMASVKYRDEAIAPGVNGLTFVDANGLTHDLSTAQSLRAELVKRGPLVVAIRYTGTFNLNASTVSFDLLAEMPSSKSWVRLTGRVSAPSRLLREIAFSTPLALGPAPWVWDFGTSRWTYGSLRTATESVSMTQIVRSPNDTEWTVTAGPKGREQIAETSTGTPTTPGTRETATFGGWGHIQGAKEVVAFAVSNTSRTGTHHISLEGTGQTTFRFVSPQPEQVQDLTVVEHFVSTPVQIGAATSPSAILSPLSVASSR